MTDAEWADYFTEVLHKLDELEAQPRTPDKKNLSQFTESASEHIGHLLGYLLG